MQLKQEASAKGISQTTLDAAFPQIKRFKKAVAADNTKSEDAKNLDTFLPEVVPEWKVNTARVLFKEHEQVLNHIADKYQVQPRFLVALWGLVADFGEAAGNYPVLSVTASHAFNGERQDFYKQEFMAALSIMDKEHLGFDDLKSNWNGAMGQTQIMPTDFLAYAQDGDGDGKKDIWRNLSDAFATAANLLNQQGWKGDDTWGRQVQAPATIDLALVGLDKRQSLAKWQGLGVRKFDNTDLPNREDLNASLIMPDGVKGRKYLVYGNYRALLHWDNSGRGNSDYFGISVVHLSERIKHPQ
ncbi:membrane-bound lytic murein transglycosylase B [Shewanella sp. HN-41]|nr:membrane-bound lytic murein transglycosylase B [Shewanella sp. HN-41]